MPCHPWPEPAWVRRLPDDQRGPAKVRYYLNLAAAVFSENGRLNALSLALGMSESGLSVCRHRGIVSPGLAVKIETALGRDLFPRELFNDVFVIAD